MGEVYRAWDERLARWVAVKHIRAEAAASVRVRARFRREARAAAALNHPAIVQIYDVVLDDRQGDWIVMELVTGTTLSKLIRNGPLSPEQLLPLLRQIADGLAEAHGKSIVHRDLKPENVMVTPSGQPKILDFGVAKRFGNDASEVTISIEGSLLGTARAMSPEQALGHQLDGRSDLFSLGSLAYEALTGRSPFLASSPVETLTRICTYEQPPLHVVRPEIGEELSLLIERLLAKEPARRPKSARRVVSTIDQMLGTVSGVVPLTPEIAAAAQRAIQQRKKAGRSSSLENEPTPQWGARQARTNYPDDGRSLETTTTAGVEPLPAPDTTPTSNVLFEPRVEPSTAEEGPAGAVIGIEVPSPAAEESEITTETAETAGAAAGRIRVGIAILGALILIAIVLAVLGIW